MSLPAAAQEFRTRYDAWLLGFPIGRAEFTSRFSADGFDISGNFRSAGLARIFERVDGTVAVSGERSGGIRPADYSLDYTSGDERQRTAIRFAGGDAIETENEPPLEEHGKWVPVRPGDLKGVSDPLSALIVKAARPQDVCDRTAKVYDGELRIDVVAEPANEALESGVVTCRVRLRPVSGYRPGHSTMVYLREEAEATVSFAPIGETALYAPVEARIGTKVGTVWVRARIEEQ